MFDNWGLLLGGSAALMILAWWYLSRAKSSRSLNCEVSSSETFGQFCLIEQIGESGSSEVYRAKVDPSRRSVTSSACSTKEDQSSSRQADGAIVPATFASDLALKVARSNIDVDLARRRFLAEMELASQLASRQAVRIFEVGISSHGRPFCVMELVQGVSLSDRLASTGPFDELTTIRILVQICEFLVELHSKRSIHGDIKPANIMLQHGSELKVRILDLGNCHDMQDPFSEHLPAKSESLISGTPSYMSPELIQRHGRIDGRSDLYSLGCLAFEMLTGQRLFRGNNELHILHQQVHQKAMLSPLETVSKPNLISIIARCLEKDIEARPSSSKELLSELKSCDRA